MAVILGITYGTKSDVQRMFQMVKHRGTEQVQYQNIDTHFMASARFNRDPTLTISSGSYKNDNLLIAVAGTVIDKDYKGLSPQEIGEVFEKKGIDFIHDISGAYVIAILSKTKLYLFRDPTGQRTIYYHHNHKRLAFCIEAKGIHPLPYYSPQLDISSIFQYFTYSFIPLGNTMQEGIKNFRQVLISNLICIKKQSKLIVISN